MQGLCQPILWQQRRGRAQRHLQTDSNRCASNVSPCWSVPAKTGAGDGWKDPLHLGHQVSIHLPIFIWSTYCYAFFNANRGNIICVTLWCITAFILVYGLWCAGILPLAMSRVLTTSSLPSSWSSFRLPPFFTFLSRLSQYFFCKGFCGGGRD